MRLEKSASYKLVNDCHVVALHGEELCPLCYSFLFPFPPFFPVSPSRCLERRIVDRFHGVYIPHIYLDRTLFDQQWETFVRRCESDVCVVLSTTDPRMISYSEVHGPIGRNTGREKIKIYEYEWSSAENSRRENKERSSQEFHLSVWNQSRVGLETFNIFFDSSKQPASLLAYSTWYLSAIQPCNCWTISMDEFFVAILGSSAGFYGETKQMQVIHLNVVETRWVWRSFRTGWQMFPRSSP